MEENVIFATILILYILFVVISFMALSFLAGKISGRGSEARKEEESKVRQVVEEEVDVGGHVTQYTRSYSVAQLRQRRYFRILYVFFLILWWQFYAEIHAVIVFIGKPVVSIIMKTFG